MNDGLLSAIESINKANKDFAKAFESPVIEIMRSQQEIYRSFTPLSEITGVYKPLISPEWMNALIVKPAFLDHMKLGVAVGAFERLKSLDNISAITIAVNQNHALYGSFLDSVGVVSSFMKTTSVLNMQAGNLAMLSLTKPNVLSEIANIRFPDLLAGNLFKELVEYGAENDIDEFGPIAQAISSDDELSQRVRDYFERTDRNVSDRAIEPEWNETYNLSFWLAVKICHKTGFPLRPVYFFLFVMSQIAFGLTSNLILKSFEGGNAEQAAIEIQNAARGHYHCLSINRIEVAITDGRILAFPRETSRLLSEFCEGEMVEVIEKGRKWMRIAYLDDETLEPKSGWVYIGHFTQLLEQDKDYEVQ